MTTTCNSINLDQLNQYMEEWIDRNTALARLGVRQQTLYAYVSRGKIGVRPDPDDSRRSLYAVNDIETLRLRNKQGRARADVASSAMSFGEPSLETSISTIHHGRLVYRGIDAASLAETATWESAAALLWESDRSVGLSADRPPPADDPFVAVASLVSQSYPGLGRSESKLLGDAELAISWLATGLGAEFAPGPLHERLARGWQLDGAFSDALRRALILLADHELNASTFAVRVAASTGAPMSACILAGLSALSGPWHGGAGAAAIALFDDARRNGAAAAIRQTLSAHGHLPGFGHKLYPTGDPRAIVLFDALPQDPLVDALRAEAEEVCGLRPNVDFALAALTRLSGLSQHTPFRLFALGRSIGWVAHAAEQLKERRLIRPRAHYVGKLAD